MFGYHDNVCCGGGDEGDGITNGAYTLLLAAKFDGVCGVENKGEDCRNCFGVFGNRSLGVCDGGGGDDMILSPNTHKYTMFHSIHENFQNV